MEKTGERDVLAACSVTKYDKKNLNQLAEHRLGSTSKNQCILSVGTESTCAVY